MVGSPKKRARREGRELMVIPQPAPEPEFRDRWGRPTTFKPEYVDQARVLCEEGMTDKELAKFFGVDRSTLTNWQFAHPELQDAMKLGKEKADDRMERRSYEVAMGYTTTITDYIKLRDNQGNEIVREITKEIVIPPNPDMLRWMLKNRNPEKWRDKTETEVKGTVVHLTLDQARERLAARLSEIKTRQIGSAPPAEG